MIKPGKDNYLTELVRAAGLTVKVVKMKIRDEKLKLKQKAEMCPSSQKIARSP